MRKYGVEHFHIELIEETDNPEEREVYWIEYYSSFKNGYNATKGGDGKRYLDYDLIISTYKEVGIINKVASILDISPDSVSKVLHQNNIPITSIKEINTKAFVKITNMYSLDGDFI